MTRIGTRRWVYPTPRRRALSLARSVPVAAKGPQPAEPATGVSSALLHTPAVTVKSSPLTHAGRPPGPGPRSPHRAAAGGAGHPPGDRRHGGGAHPSEERQQARSGGAEHRRRVLRRRDERGGPGVAAGGDPEHCARAGGGAASPLGFIFPPCLPSSLFSPSSTRNSSVLCFAVFSFSRRCVRLVSLCAQSMIRLIVVSARRGRRRISSRTAPSMRSSPALQRKQHSSTSRRVRPTKIVRWCSPDR